MSTPSSIRRLVTAAVTLPLVAGGFIALNAQSASADCGSHPAWQNRSSGAGKVISSSPIRTGPYQSCDVVKQVDTSKDLFYHCWVQNSEGHKWTHVRIANTTIEGWMYNGNLNDGGSVAASSQCTA
ncbi:SH3 domain-containing protein [Kribbella qitaiheensis]|uniref:SH3 domain-containing protein n=1 Tax=Kribbella qitaiheensis TaxID=1544730 RepID=A0A7G6X4E7_9ACTN|nr:SH3 domain-containing protein [Kribbella qitaiheensis]QNE21112.1 SH3 domain-containing protein [Kribbella qitaiheensis]